MSIYADAAAEGQARQIFEVAEDAITWQGLSPDQQYACNGVRTWLNRGTGTKQTLTLAGFAGSGKSYCVSVLAKELPSPLAFCAFTGKAASVLSRKLAAAGISTTSRTVRVDPSTGSKPYEPRPYCGTIHGLVYRPCPKCMGEDVTPEHTAMAGCREDKTKTRVTTIIVCPACLAPPPPPPRASGPCSVCSDRRFLRRDELDREYNLICVDEASMVSDDILETLLRHGVPILAVGDHGQLPPVRGAGSLMRSPDLRLEKIHRQAAGNPIIALSARIRETGNIDDELEDGSAFTILPRRKLGDWVAARFPASRLALDPTAPEGILGTVLVSWTNKLRCTLNKDVRQALGRDASPPSRGEVVVCLKNKPPAYNGMRAVLTTEGKQGGSPKTPKVFSDLWFAEDSIRIKGVGMSELQFFEEKTLDYDAVKELGVSYAMLGDLYDFGYALTCHKMQGSQTPEVGVVIEPSLARMGKEDRARWTYTAVTRAAERLTVIR
jgi:exodeoxyribonuclease-5